MNISGISGNDRGYTPVSVCISLLRPFLIQMVVYSPGEMRFIQRRFRYSYRDFLKLMRICKATTSIQK